MKNNRGFILSVAAILLFALLITALIITSPKHPTALFRVVDAAGQPVAGAVVTPEGLRTKSGPFQADWYGWSKESKAVPNTPVTTDHDGYAKIPYPIYVFEHIETGTLCLSVDHPDFVPERPERVVSTAPPVGAPWKVRLQDLMNRLQHKTLLARPDPIMLKKGAILKVTALPNPSTPKDARLFIQVSSWWKDHEAYWTRPAPNIMMTRRLSDGVHTIRTVQLTENGATWFSDAVTVTNIVGRTNEVEVTLKPGVTVRGQLDETVPRPVKNGRVIAHVWPPNTKPKDSPPQWHAWATINENGTFTIGSLPEGDLEIVALCQGFVSTNGPGTTWMRYPQPHLLSTNDLEITVGMEPTARLEVKVMDDHDKPLPGVTVMTWPNVRYGDWSAVVLAGDCYTTSEMMQHPEAPAPWRKSVPDLQGVSDASGLAVLPNLPADVKQLSAEHAQFQLPIDGNGQGRKRREANFKLIAGQTNYLTIKLEPKERSSISHY